MRPWRLDEQTYGSFRDGRVNPEVAILPLGATEPHNLHLPYGTDTFQVEAIADRACEAAHAKGARLVLLPSIPYGTETNLSRFPLAMNLNPSTLGRVIADLAETLVSSGVHKLVLLNGHGGNDLKWLLRELYGSSKLHMFICNWYQIAADRHGDLFEEAGDHAGELETSMGLFLFSSLVAKDRADSAAPRSCRFEAVRQGWVQITRPWHLLTPHSGVGDPRAASAQKGEELTRLVVERLAGFLAELSESPLDDTFPL